MKFSFFIAGRYLISKKSTNVINLISGISAFGVMFCSAALVILLSAFNGLENWVIELYNTFDPDLRIEHKHNRFFRESDVPLRKISSMEGVGKVIPVIEENGLVKYNDAQFICTLKGVGDGFENTTKVKNRMVGGRFSLNSGGQPSAILGSGIAYSLSLTPGNPEKFLELYVPRPNAEMSINPSEAFHNELIFPSGVFQIQPEFDNKYVLIPLAFARDLFMREEGLSSLEITIKPGVNPDKLKSTLAILVGPDFLIKNRFEQHAVLYKIINSEKWAVFLIGLFILLIAIFNITGSLTMLIVDKTADIKTLQTLGASWKTIRSIFFIEGLLISITGLFAGLILGICTVIFQRKYNLVMISETDPYPVDIHLTDILLISLTVITIATLATRIPASKILKKQRLFLRNK